MSKPKPDDPEQSKRFRELAKELEAEADDGLEASVKQLAKQKRKDPPKAAK